MMNKSIKQINLEKAIKNRLKGKPLEVMDYLFSNKEIQILHEHANVVSIKRLGFNDHGPVHMRKAALNALIMFDLLAASGVKFNLEREGIGTEEDSKIAVLLASLLHDLGMSISREKHEFMSVILAIPIIDKILDKFYHLKLEKKIALKTLIIEGIFGHMATQPIHSLEAGLVLVGDGCDMEKGRARISTLISNKPRVGDIHKYSSTSIQKVHILAGEKKPVKILVEMSQSVGFFQVEEVLFPKIAFSPVKKYIELYARVKDQDLKKYL